MKRISTLCLVPCLTLLMTGVLNAQSFHTVSFTGNASDFSGETGYTGANSVTYYVTFDASNFYIAAFRSSNNFGNGDNLAIYIDTDPGNPITSGTGTTGGYAFSGVTPTLPFAANYTAHIQNNGNTGSNTGYNELRGWTGSAWGSNTTMSDYVSTGALEIKIPFSSIGNPVSAYVTMFMGYNPGTYSFALTSSSTNSTTPTITNYYGGFGLTSAGCNAGGISGTPITNQLVNGTTTPAGSSGTIYGYVSQTSGSYTLPGGITIANGGSINVNGGTLITGSNTITMDAGSTVNLATSSTLTTTGSTFNFLGAGYTTGASAITFNNVTINAGTLTLTTVPTINGVFQINNGNVSVGPNYANNSTLTYNVATYTVFNEWTSNATSGQGVPFNVNVGNGTSSTVNISNSSINYYQLNGTLTVAAGSSLLQSTDGGNPGLKFGAGITNNGTYNDEGRGTWWVGNSSTTGVIQSSGNLTLNYLIHNSTSALQIGSNNITIAANSNALQFLSTGGLDLLGNTLMFSSGAGIELNDGAETITSSSGTGILSLSGTLNIPSSGSGSLSTTSSVNIVTVGELNIENASALTVGGNLQFNAGGYVNANPPVYSTGSTLMYNTGGIYGVGTEWKASTTSGAGVPSNVQVGNGVSGSGLNLSSGTYTMTGNLTFSSSATAGNGLETSGTLNIGGNWVNNTSNVANFNSGTPAGKVVFNGSSAQSLGGTNTNAGGYDFSSLTIANSSTGVTLNQPVTVSGTLTLTSGLLNGTSSNSLTIKSAGATSGGTATSYVNGPLIWDLSNTVSSNDLFPVGAGGTYLPFTINTLTGGSSPVVTITAYSAAPSGTADGTTLTSLSNTEYWTASLSGSMTGATISLGRQTSLGTLNAIGQSSSATGGGTYSSIGGTVSGDNIINSNTTGSSLGSFALAQAPSPAITSIVPTSPTFAGQANNTGYIGQTITINGTNLGSATLLTIGGTSVTIVTNTATSITFVLAAGVSGTVSVTTADGTGNYAGFTNLGYITTAAGNWSAGGTWLGGGVPPASSRVTINNNTTLNQAATVSTIIINSGSTLTGSNGGAQTLAVAAADTFTNNGTFTGTATGTVNFAGAGIANGSSTTTFNNLTINTGTLTLTTVPVINGILQINGGNVSAAPVYTSSSTLLYNVSYSRFNEWSASGVGTIGTTPGYPNNVHVSNNSTLDVANGVAGTARAMAGNLTIDNGSTVTLNATAMTQPLIVEGNFNFAGTLVLSSAGGGDIEVGGNWSFTVGGTFTSSGRAVFFIGSAQQVITRSAAGTLNFDYIVNSNTSGGIQLSGSPATNININAPNGGNGLAWSSSTTNFDLNGNTMYLTDDQSIGISGANNIISSTGTGYVTINTGTVSSVSGSGSLTFNSPVEVVLFGGLNFGSGLSTINGTLQINTGGYVSTNAPVYGTGSLLQYYSGTTPYTRGTEWTATSGAGYPYNVQISNNTTLDPGGTLMRGTALDLANNLTIDAGSSFYMDYSGDNMTVPLNIGGGLNLNGNLSESGAFGGDVNLNGNWINNGSGTNFFANGRAVSFIGGAAQTLGGTNNTAAAYAFAYLTIDNTSGGVSLNQRITVSGTLTMTSGILTTTSTNSLTITTTGGTSGGSITSYVSGPLIWDLSGSLSSAGPYNFPVGGTGYLPFSLSNVTTGATGPVIQVQAYNTGSGGTPDGSTVTSVSNTEYWSATIISGNYTTGSVSLTRQTSLGSLNAIATSSTQAGTYSSLGGTVSGNSVVNSALTGSSLGYFAFAVSYPAPVITSVIPTSPLIGGQANNTGYVAQTLTINGSNFQSNATVTIGGVAAASVNWVNSGQLTAVVAAGATGNTVVVTDPSINESGSASFTYMGYITNATGDWNTGSTWLGGNVPPTSAAATVNNNITLNGTMSTTPSTVIVNSGSKITFGASGVANISSSLTITGTVDMTSGGIMNFTLNGTFTNNGTFTYGTGRVNFAGNNGNSQVNGSNQTTFYDVTISGPTSGINLGDPPGTPNSIVVDSFIIFSGGFSVTHAPIYNTNSWLVYASGGGYNRNVEWSQLSGAAYPYNVLVENNTTLNISFGTGLSDGTARAIAGTLVVNSGSLVTMNAMTATLTIGNLLLNGGLTLSSAYGGDLIVDGNWTNNGAFVPNTRAVQFSGSNNETINGPTNFDYLTISNSTGVTLNANITVTNQLNLTTGNFILDAYNLTLFSGATTSGGSASSYVQTNGTGQLLQTVGNTNIIFPVGNSSYNPATLNNAGTSDVYGLIVLDGPFTTPHDSSKIVDRRWLVSEAVAGGSNLSVILQYNNGQQASNFNAGVTDYIGLYSGSAWTQESATQAGSNPYTFTSNANFTPANLTADNEYFAVGKDDAFILTPDTVYTWTGFLGTAWTVTGNWSPPAPIGGPNSCTSDVIIPLVANQPALSSPVSVGNVQINSDVQLTLNSNLSVCKSWTGGSSGNAIVAGSGLVNLVGSTAQTISGSTQFNELRLTNGAGASLTSGASADIITSLDLQTGNFDASLGTLTFLSTSVTQVGIIDNFSAGNSGTLTGSIVAQRYYATTVAASYAQHFVGSPVDSPALSQFGTSGTAGYVLPLADCDETQLQHSSLYGSLFSYHESAPGAASCGIAEWYVETSGDAQNGLGYSMRKTQNGGSGTLVLTGAANLNSSYTLTGLSNSHWSNTSLQGRPMSSGWQLVSNPYLATLQVTTANSGFDNQIQVWHSNGPFAGTYQAYALGSDTIAPFQAFMVHITNPGTGLTYTINASDRTRLAHEFFMQNDNELDITAVNNASGLADQTVIAFNSQATDGFDPQYDANKFGGALNRHTLYTLLNSGEWMAHNVLNSIATTSTVPMGFEPGVSGNYTLGFDNLSTFDPTTYIYLEDKQLNVMYNVRNGNYTFNADSNDNWDRFVVHFTPPAAISTVDAGCSTPGAVSVLQPGTANWSYTIIDANNVTIASGILNQSSPVYVSAVAGTYTLTLVDNNNYTVIKTIRVNGAAAVSAEFAMPVSAAAQTGVAFTNTSQNATTFTWSFGDGGIITGVANPVYTYMQPGVYTVTLTVTNGQGCTSTVSQTITIKGATGISNVAANGAISMWSYENRVYVDFTRVENVDAVVKIYNILGQELSNDRYTTNAVYEKEIDAVDAAYIIVTVRNDNQITSQKLFITNTK